jgi:hypothetical protein
MVGRPSIKHARPVVLDVVNNGIRKRHARIVNNIAHGTRAGNVLRGSNVCCKGRRDDQERLPYFADHHGYHLSTFPVSWRAPRRCRLWRAVHPMAVGQDVLRNRPVVVFATKGNFVTFVDKADIAVQWVRSGGKSKMPWSCLPAPFLFGAKD